MIPVLKKLASLLLSLLLCLSLLPGQARAADIAEKAPPIQTEASETVQPDEPDAAGILAVAGLPEEEDTRCGGD